MLELTGYDIFEQIYAGSKTQVYRGERQSDRRAVVLKVLNSEYPSFNELLQFRNQYSIAKNLDIPGIVRPCGLESYRNRYVLVMEDFGGVSLDRAGFNASDSHLEEILSISIQLADILHHLHQNCVIHKDIKPANILIHPESKQVKLIDFSIASLLPKETQEIKNPNCLEGTLAYISPEQTGRMNRGIDYRSDFYALGVTLFELLTGQLPFTSNDPMKLVHCHIAKISPELGNRKPGTGNQQEIPQVLSDLVMKLMAKNAEDRYQSALGLKHDLETCLFQLKETGKIETFEIGARDVSDRFTIPEKLYGREQEVETLLEAFDRVSNGTSELMLVAGFSGIGKTAVVNEVHKPIVRQRGYFIKGKFDQFNRNIPLSAFVQALRDLMGQLLSESDADLENWQAKILFAVGENGQVLIEVIPELEQVIGKQPIAPELSGSAVQNRFNLLFQKFIEVFTTAEHPLVMFLDDLQWADLASLQLIELLMNDNGYLLMLGAYRDNEVSPVHPFILTVEEIRKANAIVNTITLAPLDFADTNDLIADTLNCSRELAQPLTELVDRKTKGNPFFTTQFLKALHEDGYICFNQDRRYWECDIAQVNALALTDDVVEFMAVQLQKLPDATQQMLKLAACVGNQFDLETLAIVSERSPTEIATTLWKALQEGLILPTSQIYKFFQGTEKSDTQNTVNPKYRFLHDRVQQAAYSLIPEDQKQATHLQIGHLLLQSSSKIEIEEKLFDIVGHLNLGQELITQPGEREALAQLNLQAGQKARNSTAYSAAGIYLQNGMELLQSNCWQNQYELTLSFYIAATEAAYLNGDFERMEQMSTQVLQQAATILDKVKIYEIQIAALTAQGQMLAAIALGANALSQLGVEFPTEPDEAKIGKALQDLSCQLSGKKIEELLDLPMMSDRQTIAAMQLLGILFPPIFLGIPSLLPLFGSTMVSLSVQFGNTAVSTIGYVSYGMVLSAFLGEVETGYRFGRLALSLLERSNGQEFKSAVLFIFGCFIQHRQEAVRATSLTVKEGYTDCMETGQFLYAGYNIVTYFFNNFSTGVELDTWTSEVANYSATLAKAKQYSAQTYVEMTAQAAQNLQEVVSQPDCLIGIAYDERVMIPKHHQDREVTAIADVYIFKLLLAYLWGNYPAALNYITKAKAYLMAVSGTIFFPIFHFYTALTYLALFPKQSEIERIEILNQAETHQTTLHQWAHNAPMNHLHKWQLVEAERHHVLGNKSDAIEYYDRAISGAKENGYIQEEALANELAAKFYLDWGKTKIAQDYLIDAYYAYAQWGATAKVQDLEHRYPQLLAPILQQKSLSLSATETVVAITSLSTLEAPRTQSSSFGSTSISATLDLATVLKASQTLSSEIQLDKLLATLLHTVLENAGADKGVLLMPRENQWFVEAVATIEQPAQMQSRALFSSSEVPQSLINTVKRSREPVVVVEALTHPTLAVDAYVVQQQPKSVLCTPILNQGKLVAILYLENRVTVGAFTRDRVELLNCFCTQAAISLENARLYQQAQDYAQQLEQSQLQLIQSEKMSALGNLVAGVAHEINNPVGFIAGNLKPAQDYVKDLLGLLDLYAEEYPQPKEIVEEEIEAIDLDFIREDLPKLIGSMKEGTDRISHISTSLRTFSRADSDRPTLFNIHDGIDSTLLILKHRLKVNENRSEIEVFKNYGNLPQLNCFAGQLNQVFMNLIANAIDAIDEGCDRGEMTKPYIQIQTEVLDNSVVIRIQDNALGMTEEVKSRIFDHLFTTKRVGKGTGLGLAIARQIIVEKHGGAIEVTSELGKGTKFTILLPIAG